MTWGSKGCTNMVDERLTLFLTKEARQEEIVERLRRLAKARKRSLNFVALEALLRYVEEEEKRLDKLVPD